MQSLSRADLLRVLKTQSELGIKLGAEEIAALFHFSYDENTIAPIEDNLSDSNSLGSDLNPSEALNIYTVQKQYRYWYVAECKAKSVEKIDDNILLPGVGDVDKESADKPLISYSLLSPGQWQNLWDKYLGNLNQSSAIDIPQAVKQISQGQAVHHLPRVIRKRWNKQVVLILDRSKPMRPLWPDMKEAWLSLTALIGEEQLQTYYLADGPLGRWAQPEKMTDGSIDAMADQATVLMIGGFGALQTGKLSQDWFNLYDQLKQRGHKIILFPANRIQTSKVNYHLLDPRPGLSTDKLLTALALAWKPSLNQLRHLRLSIKEASLLDELQVYNHKEVEQLGGHLNLKPEVLLQRLQLLEGLEESETLKQCARKWQQSLSKMAQEIEKLQCHLHRTVYVEDYRLLQGLAKKIQDEIKHKDDLSLAYSLLCSMLPLLQILKEQGSAKEWDPLLSVAQTIALQQDRPLPLKHQGLQSQFSTSWLRQVNHQLVLDENGNKGLLALGDQAYCVQTQRVINATLPTDYKQLEIIDQGQYWQLKAITQPDWAERCWQNETGLYACHCENALFFLQPASAENPTAQWVCQHNPWSWASTVGIDQHGLWADLQLNEVRYRLRWIKPGLFMMGSPETEEGHQNDEKQHQVTLTQGYWLGETSCTQALWQAVMGNNPSYFKDSLQLPVEQISWDDCQAFINRLSTLLPDFLAQFPTEAQWEYACRAGTKTAYWWGEKMNETYANNNSAKTQEEWQYPANDFGLKSMSGNLREWCGDTFQDYSSKAVIDPVGSTKGQDRVLRGGGWNFFGRCLRSARRGACGPGNRRRGIGFRLAGGLDPQASKQLYTASRGPWNGQASGGMELSVGGKKTEAS